MALQKERATAIAAEHFLNGWESISNKRKRRR
jgi:hypothetical protein